MKLPAPQKQQQNLDSRYNTDHIETKHKDEWVVGSGVDAEIVALNVRSVSDLLVDELSREAEFELADLLNWKVRRFGHKTQKEVRGWYVNGVDPRHDYQRMEWGRFKPDSDTPVFDNKKGETAKYLSPKETTSRLVLLDVPRRIWQAISDRHGIEIGNETSFWQWVIERNVPVILAEGEKKAGCLLTLGYAAIALPGIFGGYRKATKDLIDDLAIFRTKGRSIRVCFDHETKPHVQKNLNLATTRLGKRFVKFGCTVEVVLLPGPEKGVDDFVLAQGAQAFHALAPMHFNCWHTRTYSQLTYEPSLELNQDKLGAFSILGHQPKLIGVKSPKGSGKTEMLVSIAEEAAARGQRVLLISHRVQLAQEICARINIPYITEAGVTQAASPKGYGICIDSLHAESQACFDAEDWQDAVIIIDEAEQVIWHLLESNTEVNQHRLAILEELQQLFVQTFHNGSGKVILLDADLTDVAVNFVLNLGEARFHKPWILINRHFQPDHRTCYHYDQSTPKEWLAALMRAVASGDRLVVVTQSQKARSVWSARNLEQLILKLFPGKRILRIDSETIADPDHIAYGCITKLDGMLPQYDIVLATPSIETGVSIDIRNHFDSVWGCFWGVSSTNSARQALARVRDDIPRHVWATNYGKGKVANGATSKYGLRDAQVQLAQTAIARLSAWWDDDSDFKTNEVALNTWAEMACRINADRYQYRLALISGLQNEGYAIVAGEFEESDDLPDWSAALIEFDLLPIDLNPQSAKQALIKAFILWLKEVRTQEYGGECEDEQAEDLISDEYGEVLKKKRNRTRQERLQYRKWRRHKKYGGVPVTVDLIQKDDDGWYPQMQLAYYLSLGQPFLEGRDAKILSKSVRKGQLWYPTFGKSQIGTVAELFKLLKISELQNPEREFSNVDEDMIWRAEMARQYAEHIKILTGITIAEKDTPIAIANKFLGKLDLKLTRYRRTGANGAPRPWIYTFIPPDDVRSDVFERWLERDTLSRSESVVSPELISNTLSREAA